MIKIVIDIKGKENTLTLKEAEELYKELKVIFDKLDPFNPYSPIKFKETLQ